jgi:tellurite resistance protein TerA
VLNGVTTIKVPGCKELRIEHRGDAHQYRTCAIALIEQSKHGFTVQMDTKPINGWQQDVDRHWGWGMRWSAASK